jgi:hypothetical protein
MKPHIFLGETSVVQYASTLHVVCFDRGNFLTIHTINNHLSKVLQQSQKPKKSINTPYSEATTPVLGAFLEAQNGNSSLDRFSGWPNKLRDTGLGCYIVRGN